MGWIVEQAAEFLRGDGRKLAVNFVRRNGLPTDLADDLVQDALVRARSAELRGEVPRNLEAFVTTLVLRAGRDLFRGLQRRPEGHLVRPPSDDDIDIDARFPTTPARAVELEVIAAAELARLRTRLGFRLADAPEAAAAALTVLSIRLGGAGPADDCPSPKGGAGDDEAVEWAGVFYAGCRDCFLTDGGATDAGAVRQRRSRAVRKLRSVLVEAAAEAGVISGGSNA